MSDLPIGVLDGGNLRLRPVRVPEDVATTTRWYHDPEVLRFSEGEGTPPYDAPMVERMFREMRTRCEVYIIEVRTPSAWQAIGDAALCRTAGTPIVIGDQAYRSRGIGTAVLQLLISRARALGWPDMLVRGVYVSNDRALRLYQRAGFRVTDRVTDDAGRPMWALKLELAGCGDKDESTYPESFDRDR